MKYIKPIYEVKTSINEKILLDHYDFRIFMGEIINKFPVYKCKNKPLIYGEFIFDNVEHQVYIRAIDNNGVTYSYNKEEYGKSDVVETVNENIWTRIKQLEKEGVIVI